MISIGI